MRFSVPKITLSIVTVPMALAFIITPCPIVAQSRPDGNRRVWVEASVETNIQTQGCAACTRPGNAIGPALFGAAGITLPANFGVALASRTFQEYSFDHSQHSQYVLLLGQYSLQSFRNVTLNLGTGYRRDKGDPTDANDNNGNGAVFSAGAALRLPARTPVGFSVSANVLKSVGGNISFKPTTFTLGIGINLSTSCHDRTCQ